MTSRIEADIAAHGHQPPQGMPFIASRYPGTYAFDFARQHPAVLGLTDDDERVGSRTLMSSAVQDYAEETGQDPEAVKVALAEAYLTEWGMSRPQEVGTLAQRLSAAQREHEDVLGDAEQIANVADALARPLYRRYLDFLRERATLRRTLFLSHMVYEWGSLELDLAASQGGDLAVAHVDYDGARTPFTIPEAYVADPQAWEDKVLAREQRAEKADESKQRAADLALLATLQARYPAETQQAGV